MAALLSFVSELGWPVFALASLIVSFACIVQFRIGTGLGMTAGPLLALTAPQLLPVPIIALTLVTAGIAMASTWKGIDWGDLSWSLAGRLFGAMAGAWILMQVSGGPGFQLVFGLLVLGAAGLSGAGLRFAFSRPLLAVMGALSGVMATVTSVGGPPMAIAYQDQPPERARPNLSAFFALGCVIILAVLWANGLLGWKDVAHTALLLPAMGLGLLLAPLFRGLIDRNFRRVLLLIAGGASLILVARALYQLLAG